MSALTNPDIPVPPGQPDGPVHVMVPSCWCDAPPLEEILPNVELLEEDGVPMESPWQFLQIGLLIAVLKYRWRHRNDFYVGGNMFIYYSTAQARSIRADPVHTTAFKGPDFFYVEGVTREPLRRYWVVWEEGGRYPDLIMEFLSPTTAKEDLGSKKDTYERVFHTREYFCFDPETGELLGWRMNNRRRYQKIKPDERGWLWSEELEAWLGTWEGTYAESERRWLRLYDSDGQLLPLPEEAERQRAEAAEAEVARLKARLAKQEGKGAGGRRRKRS
jgi:Uma2 family endonuclease